MFCLQWMFQRYEIVIDYEQRLRLPPPLTIISYFIMLLVWLNKSLYWVFETNKNKMSKVYMLEIINVI
jgi:hypothetical protein